MDYKTKFIMAWLCLAFLGASCETLSVSGDKTMSRWTNRVIPMPQSIKIDGSKSIAKDEIIISGSLPESLQKKETLKLLGEFAQGKDISRAKVVITAKLAINAPERIRKSLSELKNKSQAYIIKSKSENDKINVEIYAETTIGLLYAARTLKQLVVPPAGFAENKKIEFPIVQIVDYPDMEERGLWGREVIQYMPWMARWKINFLEFVAFQRLDKQGEPISTLPEKYFVDSSQCAVKAVPMLPHIASLPGNSGIRRALFDPKLKKWLAILGKPLATNNGMCCSEPLSLDLISTWLEQNARAIQGHHKELEVWLTEGHRHCSCEKCKGKKPKILETKMILKAFDRVRKKYPDCRLRIGLSQGSYRDGVHDELIEMLPEDVGLIYYNGTKTYISDRNPIIPENLSKFSKQGRFLGVVPQFTNSWRTTVPWTAPQYVHFRLKEFVDKKVNSVSGYMVPNAIYHQFNLMALAEWSWNLDGRGPAEFAEAYATVKGYKDPKLFAQWAVKAGEAGWELADSRFFNKVIHDPAMGFHGEKAFDHRFDYKETYQNHMERALSDAREALQLAKQLNIPDLIDESQVTLAGLVGSVLMQSISEKIKAPSLNLKQKKKLAEEMDSLDKMAQIAANSIYAWNERKYKELEKGARKPSQLEDSVESFLKTSDIVRTLSYPLGVKDGHPELRPFELGEWKTEDFRRGKAVFTYDITDLLEKGRGQLSGLSLKTDSLNGYKTVISEVRILEEDRKTKAVKELFYSRGCGKAVNPHSTTEFIPVPEFTRGKKILLKLRICPKCPLTSQYPENRKVNKLECCGNVYLRRLLKPEAVEELKPSDVIEKGEGLVAVSVKKRKKDGPIRVGIFMGSGSSPIKTALDKQQGIKSFLLSKLSPEKLGRCDVVIVPQSSQPTRLIKYASDLVRWVGNGGGALFLHDAVGFRRQMKLFRSVGIGVDNPKLSKLKIIKDHPVTEGLKIGTVFSPGFKYDHIIISPGASAETIIVNEKSQSVVVVGKVGRGRVVLDGMLTGFDGSPNNSGGRELAPKGEELTILVNAVKWLAGAPNLMINPDVESGTIDSNASGKVKVDGWGVMSPGSEFSEWGVTDKIAHSGKKSVFLRYKKAYKSKQGKNIARTAIFIGETNGITSEELTNVEPNTKYGFSFWMKGDFPRVDVRVFTWNTEKNGSVRRKINKAATEPVNLRINGAPMKNGLLSRGLNIHPNPGKWTHYYGTFRTGPTTKKAAVMVGFFNSGKADLFKGGETIYIDDAEIFKNE